MKKDIDGVYIPFGVKTSHTWHEIGAIFEIINNWCITCVIELGTFQGGLTLLLESRKRFLLRFDYTSIEIDTNLVHEMTKKNCNIMWADCLNKDVVISVKNSIQGELGLIYCDNGNKIEEMRKYSKILSVGDIIMCHDYYRTPVVDIPNYGEREFPKPEVFPKDLEFMKDGFMPLPDEYLKGTRIAGFIKI